VYRLHAIWDGDDASRLGDYAEALALYQRAIFDESLLGWWNPIRAPLLEDYAVPPPPEPDERPRLSAYARYRIVLLHVVQGNLREAQIAYDTLQSRFAADSVGHQYAELARVYWEEYDSSHDVGSACDKAIEHTRTAETATLDTIGQSSTTLEGVRSAVLQDILAPIYSPSHPYAPEDICPFK
jgi:hypothetical protein